MKGSQFKKVWKTPVLLGCSSMFGLLSALLEGTGVWLLLAWVAMLVPIAIIIWHLIKKAPVKKVFAKI